MSGPVPSYPHSRPFQSVHDRIRYSPIVDRAAPTWPGGPGSAVWVVPNVEHYEYMLPAGAVDPYPGRRILTSARTPTTITATGSGSADARRPRPLRGASDLCRSTWPYWTSFPEISVEVVRRDWEFISLVF